MSAPPNDEAGAALPWLAGDYRLVDEDGPRTVTVALNDGPLTLKGAKSNASLTVLTDQQRVTIDGNDVEGGIRIAIEGNSVTQATVRAPVAHVEVRTGAGQARVELPPTAASCRLTPARWDLDKKANADGERTLEHLEIDAGDATTTLNGNVEVERLDCEAIGKCTLGLALAEGATVKTLDALGITTALRADVTLDATDITLTEAVKHPATLTGDAIELEKACDVSQGQFRVLRSTQFDAEQVRGASVVCSGHVTVKGNVDHATIKADKGIHLHGDVEGAHLTTLGDGHAIRVGSGKQLEADLPEPSDPSGRDWPGNWTHGKVTGGSITAPNAERITVGALDNVELDVGGEADVYGTVTRDEAAVAARTLTCRKAVLGHVDKHTFHVDDLIVSETITASGTLDVCSRLRAQGAKAAPQQGPDEGEGQPGLHLHSANVHLSGELETPVTLEATSLLTVETRGEPVEHADVSGTLHLVKGHLACLTTRRRTTGDLNLPVGKLEVAPEAQVELTMGDEGRVDHADLSGHLRLLTLRAETYVNIDEAVVATVGAKKKQSNTSKEELETLATLDVRNNATLEVSEPEDSLLEIKPQRRRGEPTGRRRATVRAEGDEDERQYWSLALRAVGQRRCEIVSVQSENPENSPTLTLTGPVHAQLAGTYQALDAHCDGDADPTVSLKGPETSVHGATGDLRLGSEIRGSMHARHRRESGSARCLRIVGVANPAPKKGNQQIAAPTTGRLIDVDITRLPLNELDHLDHLNVLEPTAYSLHEYGNQDPEATNPDAQRAELRTKAEKLARIIALLEQRAVSGSSRAAANWAAARLHHRALPRTSPENWLRWPHRMVGYTQRPLHALATVVLAIVFVALLRVARSAWIGVPASELPSLALQTSQDVFVMPFTLVRLADEGTRVFDHDLVNLAAFAMVALPFLYLILALKNYLATPGD